MIWDNVQDREIHCMYRSYLPFKITSWRSVTPDATGMMCCLDSGMVILYGNVELHVEWKIEPVRIGQGSSSKILRSCRRYASYFVPRSKLHKSPIFIRL